MQRTPCGNLNRNYDRNYGDDIGRGCEKKRNQAEQATPAVQLFLCHALLLRLQSGTNCRHVDLVRLTWPDVANHEYLVGLSDAPRMSVKLAVKIVSTKCPTNASEPIEFFAADAITATLLEAWARYHSPNSDAANASNVYVFPSISNDGSMDFTKPLTYKDHAKAVQLCAEVLGLQMTRDFFNNLGSNAVRRGNAAKVGVEIRGSAADPGGNHSADRGADAYLLLIGGAAAPRPPPFPTPSAS
jgi:hypothetical protein